MTGSRRWSSALAEAEEKRGLMKSSRCAHTWPQKEYVCSLNLRVTRIHKYREYTLTISFTAESLRCTQHVRWRDGTRTRYLSFCLSLSQFPRKVPNWLE